MFTRPKHAYEACMQAADIIEQHKHNYIQAVFNICLGPPFMAPESETKILSKDLPSTVDETLVEAALRAPDNVCGTAYCRAGWVTLLVRGTPDEAGLLHIDHDRISWADSARRLLGVDAITDEEAYSEFYEAWGKLIDMDSNPHRYGHPDYHLEGARGLRAFALRWHGRLIRTTYVYFSDGSFNRVELKEEA